MKGSLKGRTRSSRSFFHPWKPASGVVYESDCEPPSRHSTFSAPATINISRLGGQRVRRLLKKSTSKLLSMFRLRSEDVDPSKARNELVCEREQKRSDPEDTRTDTASGRGATHLYPSGHVPEPVVNMDSGRQVRQTVPSPTCANTKDQRHLSSQHTSHDVVRPVDTTGNANRHAIRRSQSTPGLTLRLSTKISTTFGHPTVVHRTNMRGRPSLYALQSPPQDAISPALKKSGDNAQDDSDPSTAQTGSGSSPISQSTQPTSDGIHNSAALLLKQLQQDNSEGGRLLAVAPVNRCGRAHTPGKTLPATIPSIVTVEAVASAKVFFETYFNSLFSGDSARGRRERELEEKLNNLPLSEEEANRIRQAWWQQETEYLRQGRVLMTKSNCIESADNVSFAGFEVIKVLGRGSFGVVRLVKEKSEDTYRPRLYRLSSRGDLNHVKASTIGALRSAVDGSRSARRRGLNNMKKEVYAMKVIRKSAMLRNCQEGHLRAERDFLVASQKSRWIIQLIASFQDTHNLYLVMDYMIGGDFLSFLMRKNVLSEEVAKWYIAEMILCVEESHRLGWIHRDVKPDNFLISSSGHLKISDFGLAFDGHWSHDQAYYTSHRQSLLNKLGIKVYGDKDDRKKALKASKASATKPAEEPVQENGLSPPRSDALRWRNNKERRKLAHSVVGTSQYMAPEVVRGHFYDGRCDWWSIGIILYECLYGFTPFAAETREETKDSIRHHVEMLHFPMYRPSDKLISADAVDLIIHLLQEKEYRLCSRKYMLNDYTHSRRLPGELLNHPADKRSKHYQGHYVYPNDATDIKNHPFFRRTRWEELHTRKAPFVPKVKGWEDTRYFEDEQQISDINEGSTESSSSEEVAGPKQSPADQREDPFAANKGRSVNGPGNAKRNGVAGFGANLQDNNANNSQAGEKGKDKKDKKRARDKVLRDDEMGKVALTMRKRSAFLGYSYRRPKDVLAALDSMEHGRQFFASLDDGAVAGRYGM